MEASSHEMHSTLRVLQSRITLNMDIEYTCVSNILLQFLVAYFFAQFLEDVREVLYTYKTVRIFVVIAKDDPHINLFLMRNARHFEIPKLDRKPRFFRESNDSWSFT